MRLLSLVLLLASCLPPSEGMGSPQNPSATPTFPATITPPVNGDNLNATTLNTDVETPLQNGVEAARLMTYGGGVQRRVVGTNSTHMTIQPLGAVVVTVGGVWTVLPDLTGSASERVISGVVSPTAMAGGALANSTRYWVYASASGGKIAFTASVDAPDAGLRYKAASTDFMYVSTFVTTAGGGLIFYTQSEKNFTYMSRPAAGGGAQGTLLVDTNVAVGLTTVPFGIMAPATYTSNVSLYAALNSGVSSSVGIVAGTGGGGDYQLKLSAAATASEFGFTPFSTVLGDTLDYSLSGTGTLSVWLTGYTL